MAAEHGDRKIAKAHIVGEHGEQRLDDARAKAVADHDAVDVAGVEGARRALDAERADQADALAERDRERRKAAAAADQEHGCVVKRIARRQFRGQFATRGERRGAAKHRGVQRTYSEKACEPAIDPFGRCVQRNDQRVRQNGRAVVPRACDDGREGAIGFFARSGERLRQCGRAKRLAARLGQHDRFGLDGRERGGCIRPTGFNDREGAFGAQCRYDIHDRVIGNDDKRTLQRHVRIQAGRMQD